MNYIMIGHIIKFVDEIFIDLNRQMMETKCTLNLGKFFKTTPNLNKHMLQNLKLVKTHVLLWQYKRHMWTLLYWIYTSLLYRYMWGRTLLMTHF
jgi:hypothetical protein